MKRAGGARGELGRALLGLVLGLVARVWLATLRVRVVVHPALERVRDRPWVLAFWHGTQWPLLAWRRRRPTVVLVSLSRDGAMQARALALQGLRVVRGSSSRGGARGLAQVVRAMKRDALDAAFAVDGPRGPLGVVKGGLLVAARATGAVVVPLTGSMRRGFVLRRSWDRFAIAWPFTRVDVVLGEPIDPRERADAREEVERSLAALNIPRELASGLSEPGSVRRLA
ncbi:MAG: lysophospholipid acyltransferase family protein [Polyangiaceae bacterium]